MEKKKKIPSIFLFRSGAAQSGSDRGSSSSAYSQPSHISPDHFWTVNKNPKIHSWCSCACGQDSMCYYFNLTLLSIHIFRQESNPSVVSLLLICMHASDSHCDCHSQKENQISISLSLA